MLTQDGWYPVSQKGSHIKMRHPVKPGVIIFPNHGDNGKRLRKEIIENSRYQKIMLPLFKKKIKVVVEKTDSGFSAFALDYPVFTTANHFSGLLENMVEAFNLYLEDDGYRIEPKNLNFEIDLKQFFRHYRVINTRFLAERIGMNPTLLSQYVQGRKKPSAQQTEKILKGIHQIGRELTELSLVS